jgi:putative ABC transport system permease protein
MTVLAIGLSVACGGLLLRLYKLSESRFSTLGKSGDAIVGAKAGGIEILLGALNGEGDFPGFLPDKLFQSLRAEQTVQFEDGHVASPSSIQSIIPFVYFAKWNDDRVIGTDESFLNRPRGESLVLSTGHWFSQVGEVVLGASAAQKYHVHVDDTIKVHPWIGGDPLAIDLEMKVTGILMKTDSQWDRSLFASVEQAHQVFAQYPQLLANRSIWGSDILQYFLVYLKPGGFESFEALINRRTVGQVIRIEKEKERLQDLSGAGRSIGIFVTSFVLLLGALAVCAMFVTRFEAMSLQLAVLRALGFRKRELAQWLLWEGSLLALMGIFLGAVIDLVFFPILRDLLGTALPPADLVSSSVLQSGVIWLAALAATLLAIFVPMIQMSRQDAHQALKGL